jgi:hypothetical protein
MGKQQCVCDACGCNAFVRLAGCNLTIANITCIYAAAAAAAAAGLFEGLLMRHLTSL